MILWININEAKTAPKSGSKNKLIEAAKWSQHFQTPPQLNWSKWSVKTESTLAIHLHFLSRNQTHLIHVGHLQTGTVLKITFISYSSMCFYCFIFKTKFTVGWLWSFQDNESCVHLRMRMLRHVEKAGCSSRWPSSHPSVQLSWVTFHNYWITFLATH